jgi:predicted RNase H-like HicB family nuclease
MRNVKVLYRPEGPGWVASSPEAPDYIAYAESLAEAVKLAHEGIAFHFDVEEAELRIADFVNTPPGIVLAHNTTGVSGVVASVSGAIAAAINVGESVMPSAAQSIPENVAAELRIAPASAT